MSKGRKVSSVRFANLRGSMNSVFVRCALIMAVTTIVVAGVLAVQSTALINELARHSVVVQATQLTELKAASLVKPLRFKATPQIEAVLDETERAGGGNFIATTVVGADGAPVAFRGDEAAAQELAQMAQEVLETGVTVINHDGLWAARPVVLAEGEPPIGVIGLSLTDASALAAVAGDKQLIVIVAVAVFALMLAVTVVLLGRSLGRPLRKLEGAIAKVAEGDYDSEIQMQERRDELGAIARELDHLLEELRAGRAAEASREKKAAEQAEVVRHLGDGLKALAKGILNRRVAEAFPEEYEALRANFNSASESLSRALGVVMNNAESIANGVDEISRASDDLARRTETQAATLEETAAALDELLQSVRGAADNAVNADEVVRDTREMASRNDDVMRSAMSAMSAIEKSSEQIGEIISVIDDIAFQTNLLALNAGVEAARAGESGKGFAVVASEVRALAQRSSDAARQIKDLISGSTEQVKTGVRLVESAGSALEEVVARVGEISDLVSGIAKSANEQSHGLNEINTGVNNLDQVTQQNAAMVEESTAAAHMLRSDAANLKQLVASFEISAEDRKAKPDAAKAKARAA